MPTVIGVAAMIVLALRPKILGWLFTTIRREVVGLWLDYDQHRRMKNVRDET
jgi:hypothetical protein